MNPSAEVRALAVHALKDLHYRGELSLQFRLSLNLSSQSQLEELLRLIYFPTSDFDDHRATPLLIVKVIETGIVRNPFRQLRLMCHLAMERELRDYPQLGLQIADDHGQAAAEGGSLTLVQRLLEHGARLEYCLYGAVHGGHLQLVEYLLDQGAPSSEALGPGYPRNYQEVLDVTFHTAARAGHLSVVKLLLDRVGSFGMYEETSMWAAARRGHLEVVELLLSRLTQLHRPGRLIEVGSVAALQLILSRHQFPFAELKATKILATVAREGDLDFFVELLAKGARPEPKAKLGLAIGLGGKVAILELVLDVVQVNLLFLDYALRGATQGGHTEMMGFILDRNPDISADNAFIYDVPKLRLETLRLLVSTRRVTQNTLQQGLMELAMKGHLEKVQALLEAGAIPSAEAYRAARSVYPEVAALLESPVE